jgi:hypothetical protein
MVVKSDRLTRDGSFPIGPPRNHSDGRLRFCPESTKIGIIPVQPMREIISSREGPKGRDQRDAPERDDPDCPADTEWAYRYLSDMEQSEGEFC